MIELFGIYKDQEKIQGIMYAEKPKYYTTARGGSALGLFGEASNLSRGLANSSSDADECNADEPDGEECGGDDVIAALVLGLSTDPPVDTLPMDRSRVIWSLYLS